MRTMRLLGVILVVGAIVLASGRAFERSGLLEKWLGWSTLHGFFERTVQLLSTTPLLVGMMAAGSALIAIGVLWRR